MSRKLGVLVLAMGILVGAMGLKTIAGTSSKAPVLMANGCSPIPPPLPQKPNNPSK